MACVSCISATTTVNYIPAILTAQEQEIIADAKLDMYDYLQQAVTYGQQSLADAVARYEAKANVIAQIVFSLERASCLTEVQRKTLLAKIGSFI